MFILTTFIVQIVLLNMFIAIMSDTYDRVRDQMKETILKERLSIMAEHVPFDDEEKPKACAFILSPIQEESQEDDWSGRLKDMKESVVKATVKM